jgi:hypothetical protein
MSCPDVTALEYALAPMPLAILPASGLRRDSDGTLTEDALTMVVDGLKAKGMILTDPDKKKSMMDNLSVLLCSINKQYQFLLNEISRLMTSGEDIEVKMVDAAKEKNNTMRDIIVVARHIYSLKPNDESSTFIEGWQNSPRDNDTAERARLESFQTLNTLNREAEMLNSGSYLELRKHMVEVTQEKNRMISNYLGIYGFLNVVAVGLLIYIAGSS